MKAPFWKLGPWTLLGVLVLMSALTAGWQALRPPPLRVQIQEVREQVALARGAADSCQIALAREEASFRDFEGELSLLRGTVEALEGLHPDGVPQPRYEEYMAAFDAFNEAVPEWDERAQRVQHQWEECRSVIAAHNLLADSLRALAVEAGSLLVLEERIPSSEPDYLEAPSPQ